MSKIHILSGGIGGVYTVAIHAPTPAGNNSAGVSWANAIQASGRNTSILPVGNGTGQVTQNEMNQIAAGTVIEGVMQWQDVPGATPAELLADIDLRATQLVNDLLSRYAIELKYFGLTRA